MTRTMRTFNKVLSGVMAAIVAGAMLSIGPSAAVAAELLMFETRGCPWCAAWTREVGPGYARSTEGQRAPLRRLDVADAAKSGVALALPVSMSPTFVLVDKGREVGRIVGYPGADFFWGLLAQAIAKLDPVGDLAPRTPSPVLRSAIAAN